MKTRGRSCMWEKWLTAQGLRAPEIYAERPGSGAGCCWRISAAIGCATGWMIIRRARCRYRKAAIDALVALHRGHRGRSIAYSIWIPICARLRCCTEWFAGRRD
jgi:hypothetical protein